MIEDVSFVRRPAPDIRYPYPGLRPFLKHEHSIFFGRERMKNEVIERIAHRPLILIHGPSGCGKSSLVRAGVLPQLEKLHTRKGIAWHQGTMRPGNAPLWHLASALVEALQPQEKNNLKRIRQVRLDLNDRQQPLKRAVERLGLRPNQRLTILVDQFEEIFRFATETNAAEAARFVTRLLSANESGLENVFFILTMRSDHLGDCGRFEGLAEAVNSTQYLVPPMNDAELRQAIQMPARRFNGEIDDAVVDALISDTLHEDDRLPLVQHALTYLWLKAAEQHKPVRVTIEDYQRHAQGDPGLALSAHADEAMGELTDDPAYTLHVERLFRTITHTDSEGRAIRRPRTRDQIVEETGISEEALEKIIRCFSREGRSFVHEEEQTGEEREPLVDVSHEALIRHWEALASKQRSDEGYLIGWLAREVHDSQAWRQLTATARARISGGQALLSEAEYVHRKNWFDQFAPTKMWSLRYVKDGLPDEATSNISDITRVADLLTASKAEIDRRVGEKEADYRRERKLRQQITAVLAVAVVLLVSVVSMLFFYTKANEKAFASEKQAQESEQQAQASKQQAIDALERFWQNANELAKEKIGEKPEPLIQTLLALEFLPDQNDSERQSFPKIDAVEAALKKSLLRLREIPLLLGGHDDEVDGVAVSPDGQLVVTGSDDRIARIWNADGQFLIRELIGHTGNVSRTAFSPDGIKLVTGSIDNTARIWDVETGETIRELRGHLDGIWGVAWSPDGQLIATGSFDGTARIWNAETGDPLQILDVNVEEVNDVDFSPHGSLLVAGASGGKAIVWNTTTGAELFQIGAHNGKVFSVAWSPDGKWIATGSEDNSAQIWDAETKQLHRKLPHTEQVWATAFSPDSRRLATGNDDDQARIWDVESGDLIQHLKGHKGDVDAVAWLPDGVHLVTGSDDGTARVWTTMSDEDPEPKVDGQSTQALVERAQQRVHSCFSELERADLNLQRDPPKWCTGDETRSPKPPFDIHGRMEMGQALLLNEDNMISKADQMFERAYELDPSLDSKIKAVKVKAAFQRGKNELEKTNLKTANVYFDYATEIDAEISGDIRAAKIDAFTEKVDELLENKEFGGETLIGKITEILKKVSDENEEYFSDLKIAVSELMTDHGIQILDQTGMMKSSIFFGYATELDPKSKHSKHILALQHVHSGYNFLLDNQAEKAMNAFDKALQFDSDAKSQIISVRAKAALEKDNPPRAILLLLELLLDAKTLNPDDITRDFKPLSLLQEAMGTDLGATTLEGHDDEIDGVAVSPDGKLIVTGSDDKTARIWNTGNGALIQELTGHSDRVKQTAFSPDGTRLVTGSSDQTARIWNVETGNTIRELEGHSDAIWGVAWSPNGKLIATGSYDGTARIWDAGTGSELQKLSANVEDVNDVAFSPDGSLLVTGLSNGHAAIWNATTGEELFRIDAHVGEVLTVAWSPDGNWIATGSDDDSARIWDAKTKELRHELPHTDEIWGTAFSPDSTQLATGATDDLARIWDVESGTLVQELGGHDSDVNAVAWLPDGNRLVTGSDDGTARVWIVSDKSTIERAKQHVETCFGEEERVEMGLNPTPPAWCDTLGQESGSAN